MLKNTYVLNPNDRSTTYRVTSDTKQSRGRRQIQSTEAKKLHKNVQVAESSLVKLSDWEAQITLSAEQILRNKKAMTDEQRVIVAVASSNENQKIKLNGTDKDFYAGHTCVQWCEGVLDNVRRITGKVELKAGLNTINVFAGSPNVSFDKIILWKEGMKLPHSYLGPKESYRA